MISIFKSKEMKGKGIGKQLLLAFLSIFAFLTMLSFKEETVKAAGSVTVSVDSVSESNYKGNNTTNGYAAKEHVEEARWFVQGTGIKKQDTISFSVKITNAVFSDYQRIAIAESGFSMTEGANADYDAYYFDGDNWVVDGAIGTDKNKGFVTTECSAGSDDLKANGGAYDSLFCISNDGLTLNYVYTIRSEGYGLKTITIWLYEINDATSEAAEHVLLNVVVSKPISEFNNNTENGGAGFDWISTAGGSCSTNHAVTRESGDSSPGTEKICATYINSGSSDYYNNEKKYMDITIPKEVAFNYIYSDIGKNASTIPNNAIYSVNTFQNSGSSKYVKYYYYDFVWESYELALNGGTIIVDNNENMDSNYKYALTLEVDASGKYSFYITDYFGNKFATKENEEVEVKDVSIRNILIDYTNADLLTIMAAEVYLSGEDDGEVVIPDKVVFNEQEYKVTSIGKYAFCEFSNLETVQIPASESFEISLAVRVSYLQAAPRASL